MTGGDWDFGFYGQVEQGGEGYKLPRPRVLGKIAGELGFGFGDLQTGLGGVQAQVGAMVGVAGGQVGYDANGANQFTFRLGAGWEVGGSKTATGVLSIPTLVREAFNWLRK